MIVTLPFAPRRASLVSALTHTLSIYRLPETLFLSLFRALLSVFDMYLECLPFLVVGFLSAFVVSCVVVVNGQQHHVCRCALSLLIAEGLIADGQQHHVCGVMRSRS